MRKPKKQPPPPPEWNEFLFGSPARTLTAIVAIIGALAYLLGFFRPALDSGPMPFPSRSELNTLKQETTKTLDEVLSLATAASVRAEQAVQQSTDNRLDRLLQQRVDLQARSAAAPNDVILKQSLARTDIDIARLLGQTSASATTAVK